MNESKFTRIRRALFGTPQPAGIGPLATHTIGSFDDYVTFHRAMASEYTQRLATELALISDELNFVVNGYCYVCRGERSFDCDFLYSDGSCIQGKRIPNWRERLTCRGCGLNNRLRACIHFLEQNLQCQPDARLYLAEQATPLYAYLKPHYPNLIGSEYFGERLAYGAVDPATGWRNESVTKLTFAAASLDYILSFDVYEHVPDYRAALGECARCLKPGGSLLFTVPFNKGAAANEVRARVDAHGNIEHLLPPIFHGDPINKDGCLAWYTFGWEILEQLAALGFRSARAHLYWSRELGYLGHEQLLLVAQR